MRKEDVKVGEIYRIREWDDMKEEFGTAEDGLIRTRPSFVRHMKHLCGAEARVIYARKDGMVKLEFLNAENLGDTVWAYSADMLEPLEDEPLIDVDPASIFDLLGV